MSTATIHGIQVFVTPDLPKMKLAPGDYVTPEFRAEIDIWLLDFFGAHNLLKDGEAVGMPSTGQTWMNPRTYARLRSAL